MDHRLHVTDPGQIEIYTNGFPNRTDSTISFTDGSRTFSIQPTGAAFEFSVQGIIYSSTGDTVVIDNTEGIHVVYYDDAVLTALANPTAAQIDSVIRTKALVSFIYWDVSAVAAIHVGEERHGDSMSPVTHAYLHFINGLEYVPPGLGLSDFTVDQDGADDEDAQFAVDAGGVSDEDIFHTISSIVKTTGLPIYYLTGAGADWNRVVNAGFSVRTYDGTTNTRLPYNQYTGGAWQLTEVTNAKYVLCHIFATAEKDTPMLAFVGQAEYANRNAARTGAETEVLTLITNDTLSHEMRPIGTVIFKTSDATGNSVNAAVWTTADGDNYIDWRSTTISRVELTTSDHNSLSGLQGGAAGDYFHFTETQHDTLTDGSNAQSLHRHLEDYTTLTYAASITPDADTVSRFDLQLTGNATINKPSNLTAGQRIEYRIEQDTGGTNEITWSSDYRTGELPTTQVAQGGNEITYVLCLYHEDDDKMDIVAFMRGYE